MHIKLFPAYKQTKNTFPYQYRLELLNNIKGTFQALTLKNFLL